MIPKNDIVGIDINESGDIMNKLIHNNHTRMPVFSKSLNNLKGFINKKHILKLMSDNIEINLQDIALHLTEPYYIPEDTSLLSQLITFKKEKKRIGCVVDEYGDIKGLLTLDDILEEIVGEYGAVSSKKSLIKNISVTKLEVHGSAQIRDINKKLGINLTNSSVTTINGLILESLQEIPQEGMTFTIGNTIIEVLNVKENFVEKALILKK